VTVGTDLTAARTQAGLTLSQVSERTRIRAAIVAEIEHDDFSGCGGDFYARGHIRAIARAEGLDPEPLIQQYDASHGLPTAQAAAAPAHTEPRRAPSRRTPLLVAAAVAAAAVLGLVSYRLVTASPTPAAAHHPAAAGQHAAAAGRHASAPRRHPAGSPTSPSSTASHAAANLVITVTAVTEPCWVQLTAPGGAPIFVGIIGPGSSRTWTRRRPVLLDLGNPGAVTVTVNGIRRTGLGPQPVMLHLHPGRQHPG
jgi:cytoskeleton protein RodZ